MKMIPQGDRQYISEDGVYEIVYDENFDTWCDEPHPVRFSRETIENFQRMSDWQKRQLSRNNWSMYYALLNGQKGYYCEGNAEHTYGQWTVGYVEGNDYIGTEGVEAFDTMREAVSRLEHFTGEKVTVSRPRKPKPDPFKAESFTDKAGRKHFAACGHPFEFDIDMNCYECHQDPLDMKRRAA